MYHTQHLSMINYHQRMLQDEVRTRSYQEAVHAVVKPGDIVIDLGAGTGIMTYFACQAGARKVYAIEAGPISSVTAMLLRANNFSDRVELMKGFSKQLELPQAADVLITEIIGGFGFDEGILAYVSNIRDRFLKPQSRIIPSRLQLFAVPLQINAAYNDIQWWRQPLYGGLDFSKLRPLAANNLHFITFNEENFIASPGLIYEADLAQATKERVQVSMNAVVSRTSQIHGIGLWFNAQLTPGIQLSNAPPLQTPSWSHGFLPLLQPIHVETGQELQIDLSFTANGAQWLWDCRPADQGADQPPRHASFKGQLFSAADLKMRAPNFVPELGQQAAIDRFILNDMADRKSLAQIADRLSKEFADYFPRLEDPLARVRRIVEEYAT